LPALIVKGIDKSAHFAHSIAIEKKQLASDFKKDRE